MAGYLDRVKRRTDEAIEMGSGASREEARRFADENARMEEEDRRRRKPKKRPLMSEREQEDWGNTFRRMLGMRRDEP